MAAAPPATEEERRRTGDLPVSREKMPPWVRRRVAMLLWIAPAFVWQVLFFVGPLAVLLAMTFWSVRNYVLTPDMTLANWRFILAAPFFRSAYIYTFELAALTALLSSIIAFPAAYALGRMVGPGLRRLLIFMLIVPFFTNYPVRIYSLEIFLSPQGIVNHMLSGIGFGPIDVLGHSVATMTGLLTLVLPLVVLLQSFSLMNVDRAMIEAAQNLGCSRIKTLFTVTLPSVRNGLTLAATFAFILSFGDYVSPLFLGNSRPPTLSILIADQVKSGDNWPRASVVAAIMIVTLMIILMAALRLANRKPGRPA